MPFSPCISRKSSILYSSLREFPARSILQRLLGELLIESFDHADSEKSGFRVNWPGHFDGDWRGGLRCHRRLEYF